METLFWEMDVPKLSISVPTAEDGRNGAVRFCGEVANTREQVTRCGPGTRRPSAISAGLRTRDN